MSCCRSSVSFFSLSLVTRSWLAKCWRLSIWGWWWTRFTFSHSVWFEMYGGGSLLFFCIIAQREERALAICWYFSRKSAAFVPLKNTTLAGLFGNASVVLDAILYASVMSKYSSGPICSSSLAFFATITILSNPVRIFAYLATHIRRGTFALWMLHPEPYFCVLLACS